MPMTVSQYQRTIAALTILSLGSTQAQGLSEYELLWAAGARANAMGNAVLSDAGDATAMFLNPASLTHLEAPALFLDHRSRLPKSGMEHTAGLLVSTGSQGRFAVAISASSGGSFTSDRTGVRARRLAADIAQSLVLAQSFSAGLLAGASVLTSASAQLMTMRAILGLHYTPSPEITYALTLRGFEVRSVIRNEALWEQDPGISPGVLGIGMSMRFPSSFNRQDFTLALANEKRFGSPGLTYRIGAEYYIFKTIALRAGGVTGPEERSGRMGIGYRGRTVLLDATFAPGGPRSQYQLSCLFQL